MLTPGDSFGDYKVVRLLGQGGMGSVYLLENAEGGQIAAKILDPVTAKDHESRKRFLREAQLALGVKHPNLVETYDVGEDPDTGLCYILMEYVPDGSLADRIKSGPLPINDAIRIVYQIASVLELARQKGIVHRDIKPGNIMFGSDGKAKLADLGIARGGIGGTETTTVTQTGMMIGTPAYMAPEQMLDAHKVDTRADIYSLGVVFFEMLTGKRPNHDDTVVQLMAKAVAGEPIPDVRTMRPEVSASLAELINLMCAMKADERVQTPVEVTTAISQIVHGREVTIVRKRPSAVARKPAKSDGGSSRKVATILFGCVVIAGVAAFVYLGSHGRSSAISPSTQPVNVQAPPPSIATKTNEVEKIVEKVVERIVEKPVASSRPKQDDYRSPFVLRKISAFGPSVQKRLQDMGSHRISGERRGVMVFGRLKVDGKYDGKDVANWAWMLNDGWFSADIWPSRNASRLLFLKHGYEPLEIDLSKEADREWSADEAYDLGTLEMRRLSEDRQCTLSLTVRLPPGVHEGELRLEIDNRQPCGCDWGLSNCSLQRPRIEVLRRRVSSGEEIRIDGCTPTNDKLKICAEGCVCFKKDIDVADATARNLKTVSLLRVKRATFAVRPFSGGEWEVMSVLADNDQSLHPDTRSRRHTLRLNPYECDRGLSVSSFHQPSTYDDYGAITTNMLDRQLASGTQAAPISLHPRGGDVDFFPGRIYRFRKSSSPPIDVLIAFLDYREEPLKNAEPTVRKKEKIANGQEKQIRTAGGLPDPEQLKDPNSTRAVQKALDALFPGWKVSAVDQQGDDSAAWAIGYQPSWRGGEDVVTTMPPSMETPTVLSRRVELGKGHPVLNLEVASQNVNVDFVLSVRVNGKTALEPQLICTPEDSPYARIQVPLSAYRGRKVLIEIVHAANNWSYEHAFWKKIEITEGTGKEDTGLVGVKRVEVFPAANPDNVKWLRRTPWRYTEKEPGESWKAPSFDDSRWRKSAKAFGRDAGSRMSVAERWQGERIWLRRSFSWNASEPVYNAVFNLSFDQDVEIFLNGTQVLKRDGWNTGWDLHAADRTAFAGALRQGENVLAVTLNGDGPSFFDCGLVVETLDRELQSAESNAKEAVYPNAGDRFGGDSITRRK